jgi:hypothetical protein
VERFNFTVGKNRRGEVAGVRLGRPYQRVHGELSRGFYAQQVPSLAQLTCSVRDEPNPVSKPIVAVWALAVGLGDGRLQPGTPMIWFLETFSVGCLATVFLAGAAFLIIVLLQKVPPRQPDLSKPDSYRLLCCGE